MQYSLERSSSKPIAIWLLIGVAMIMMQVLLGGITRLTESGLSITEWKPLTGILPPLNTVQWQAEFDKYKNTDQFKYIHADFTLKDFKFIFFWEWFHRLWARLLGIVFLAGFIYFLIKKRFKKEIYVTDIQPGFVDTGLAKGDKKFWVATTNKAALQIYKAINNKRKRAYITHRWWMIAKLLKWMPGFIYKKFA